MVRLVKSSGIEWLSCDKFESDMKGYSPGGPFTIQFKSGKTVEFHNLYKQRNHRHWLISVHAVCQKERGGLYTTLDVLKEMLAGSVHTYSEPIAPAVSAASVVKTDDLPETLGVSLKGKYPMCRGDGWMDLDYFVRDTTRYLKGKSSGTLELWTEVCDAKGEPIQILPASRSSIDAGALLTVLAVMHNDFMQNLTNRYSLCESAVAESNGVLRSYFKSGLWCCVRIIEPK